jgi:hypothetical protein
MAVLGDAVYARLTAHAGTAALVGTRVYPLRLPQGMGEPSVPYPAIRFQVFERARTHLMGADLNERHAEVQIDCYAESYEDAHELAEAVVSALSRWEGTAGGVTVIHFFLEGSLDMDEPTVVTPQGEESVCRVMHQFVAHWQD